MQASPTLSPLSKEICFGVCRHYFRLEALANRLLTKRPKSLEVWVGVLIGLYQLHYLRIPDYAVVKETVALMQQLKMPWAKALVNAVLRTYCREQEKLLTALKDDPAFVYGHPAWITQRLQTAWPNDWQNILQANDNHPPMTLRVNAARISVENYLAKLQAAGVNAHHHPYAKQALVLEKPCDVHDLPEFGEGEVSVQDAAAQLAVALMELKPGLRVLDACCAPGGKTGHILETESHLSACVALDIEKRRLTRVEENLNRLQLQATLLIGDAAKPESWWDGIRFDRILLDAPCSATGVIRRNPDIKLLRSDEEVEAITDVQQKLLNSLWPLLAPGGILVYATCSVMPEENEKQISRFIENHSDCSPSSLTLAWGKPTGHGWQILPGEQEMDGFFYSQLIKSKLQS